MTTELRFLDPWLLVGLSALLLAGSLKALQTALITMTAPKDGPAKTQRRRAIDYYLERPSLLLSAAVLSRGALLVLWLVALLRVAVAISPGLRVAAGVAFFAVLAEWLPVVWAKPRAGRLMPVAAELLRWWATLLQPLLGLWGWLSAKVSKLLGGPGLWQDSFLTYAELSRLQRERRDESLSAHERQMLSSIVSFSDTVIKEIMVPRTEMVAVADDTPKDELLKTIVAAGHSRIPVFNDTPDAIVGVLHVKDFFLATWAEHEDAPWDLSRLCRPTFFVPEAMKITTLLREFQRRQTHMAIVVDEYGGTAGVVTLEDVLEEIVGEIQDEYDVEEKQYRTLSDGRVLADARVYLWDLEAPLKTDFPDGVDFETLGGFLMAELGHLPKLGETLHWRNLRFLVTAADERKISKVEIQRTGEGEASAK